MPTTHTKPLTVEWLIADRVICVRYAVTLRQFDERDRRILAMLESITHDLPVHVIIDHTGLDDAEFRTLTATLQAYIARRGRPHPITSHPNFGAVAVISPVAKVIDFSNKVLSRVYDYRSGRFECVEDGLAFLRTCDPSLPPLSE